MEQQDTPDFTEIFTSMQAAMGTISTTMQALAQHMQEKLQQVLPIVEQIYAGLYERYREDGMPYGDTYEGFMRWLDDMNKIHQHQHEIESILQRQQHLIDMRNFGEKIRAKREQQQ